MNKTKQDKENYFKTRITLIHLLAATSVKMPRKRMMCMGIPCERSIYMTIKVLKMKVALTQFL